MQPEGCLVLCLVLLMCITRVVNIPDFCFILHKSPPNQISTSLEKRVVRNLKQTLCTFCMEHLFCFGRRLPNYFSK